MCHAEAMAKDAKQKANKGKKDKAAKGKAEKATASSAQTAPGELVQASAASMPKSVPAQQQRRHRELGEPFRDGIHGGAGRV